MSISTQHEDSAVRGGEILYDQFNTGIFERQSNYQPDTVKSINSSTNRVFISGAANPGGGVRYSNPFQFGAQAAVSFDVQNRVILPYDIISVEKMDSAVVFFTDKEIYHIDSTQILNSQVSGTMAEVQNARNVVPENQNSTVAINGGILFKSSKGIFLLGRDLSLTYMGMDVELYNDQVCRRSVLSERRKEVYFLLEDVILVYSTNFGRWSTLDAEGAVDISVDDGDLVILYENHSLKVERENTLDELVEYELETTWLNLSSIQGYQRARRVELLGNIEGAEEATIEFAYNFGDNYEEKIEIRPRVGADQYRIGPKRQKCSSLKVRIKILSSKPVKLSGLAVEYYITAQSGVWKH